MRNDRWKPEIEDITRSLKVCANLADLDRTKKLHLRVIDLGIDDSLAVAGALVHSYIRCGSIGNARSIFDSVRKRDVILWTTLITGYAQLGRWREAFAFFSRMCAEGDIPNDFTYASILKASANVLDHRLVLRMHSGLLEAGFGSQVTIGNALIDVYGKIGNLDNAFVVFKNMHRKDVISWSTMISSFGQYERWKDALVLFKEMHRQKLQPNNYTYVSIFKACASLNDWETCRHLHSQVVELSWEVDVYIRTTLLDTYVKCGCIKDAREVFESIEDIDLISVNTMLYGYADNALAEEAIMLFLKTQNECLFPDKFTYATTLKACASAAFVEEGSRVHVCLMTSGVTRDSFLASTLVDMYIRFGQIDCACQSFNEIIEKDVILWNSFLVGFTQEGGGCDNAIGLYDQMLLEGLLADACTYVILVKACVGNGALVSGKRIHARLTNCSILSNIYVRSSLVDMYSKAGSLENARNVFESAQKRDVILWNAMLTAYAQQGHSKEVFTLAQLMQEEGVKPSAVTFGCVLSACRHSGLIEDACENFKSLVLKYNMKPSAEHVGCIIDLFARVGRLNEAADFLSNLPSKINVEPWIALLAACKIHADVGVAERAFENIDRLVPEHVGPLVALSQVYAAAENWDSVNSIILSRLPCRTNDGYEQDEQFSRMAVSSA